MKIGRGLEPTTSAVNSSDEFRKWILWNLYEIPKELCAPETVP